MLDQSTKAPIPFPYPCCVSFPHFKFRFSVQAAGRNLGTERSEILKLAEVLSSVSPCPLIVHQREPRGDQHVSE